MNIIPSPQEFHRELLLKKQRLSELGFSPDRQKIYSDEILNTHSWDKAFDVASVGLSLTLEQQTFAADVLSDLNPELFNPSEYA